MIELIEVAQAGGSGIAGILIGVLAMNRRIKRVEDKKVDTIVCKISHEGLGHEIRDIKDTQTKMSDTQTETLKVVSEMSGFMKAKFGD